MKRRQANRNRQKQINILHTTTRKRHSQQQVTHTAIWSGVVLAMVAAVGIGLHFGLNMLFTYALYTNPHYVLNKIEIEPEGHFSPRAIRQAAGLETGQNLWTLNLPQIAQDLQKLPYVSSARVERHFPDRVTIRIVERVPVVKIVGLNDLGARETFYLDRDCVALKPRDDESVMQMPEVIGLTNAELEPGARLDQRGLGCALAILDAIDNNSQLHTSIDIKTIDLSQPLSITMTTTHDMSITFRLDNVDQQMLRLQQLVEYYSNSTDQRALHTVDLTPDRYVPVTFYE